MPTAKYRLKKRKSINSLFRTGKSVSGGILVIKFKEDPKEETRIGFSAGLKFSKKAHERNSAKRWMRAAIKEKLERIKPGSQILLLINSKCSHKQLNYNLISDEIENLLKKAKILQ